MSEVDKAIIRYLEEHNGKTLQRDLLSDLRATWNEHYIHGRIRTLESRGHLVKEKDTSGHVLLVRLRTHGVSA